MTRSICLLAILSTVLSGCISIHIPIGDAIDSTKDWINEARHQEQKTAEQK